MQENLTKLDEPLFVRPTIFLGYATEEAEDWVFHEAETLEESGRVFEISKDFAETLDQAEALAKAWLINNWQAYNLGIKEGQAEAQRFFRVALGVEIAKPDDTHWNIPVPLKYE